MGYDTEFTGVLKFATEPTVEQIREINDMIEKAWERKLEGCPRYLQFKVTPAMDGIEWDGTEKFYETVECVNFLVAKMREKWPNFGLVGEMHAQGEDTTDRWILRMVDGVAERIDDPPKGREVTCPRCYDRFFLEDETR